MTCGSCGLHTFLESVGQIGSQSREGGCETAESPSNYGEDKGKAGDPCVDGDRVDAWHRLGKKTEHRANRNCGKCQSKQTAGSAEQQSFQNRLSNDRPGSRAQSQSDSVFPTSADRAN